MFDKNLFLIDNEITDIVFNTVINLSLPLKEYKWIEKFIERYKNNLSPLYAKDAYNLAMAKLYFQKKDYDKVFSYLNNVEFKNPYYYINSKFILSRIYYDWKDYKSLPYIIDNLRQYIREKFPLAEEYKLAAKTFIKYFNNLIRITELNKKERKTELMVFKKQLKNEGKFIPNKNWFYEKIEESE